MLEAFDEIQGKNKNDTLPIMKSEFQKNPGLIEFLTLYIENENQIITPIKILAMMRYFRVERSNSMDKIEEIGDFAKRRTAILKLRESKKKHLVSIEMKNINFLIDVYTKLQTEVMHKNQYKILKKCFLLLSSDDIKWFTRFLCNKIEITEEISEAMLCYKNNSNAMEEIK